MLGVLLHVLTDALNNLSVIIAALIIWKSPSDNRFYADPAIGIFIALTITLSAVPLCRRAGQILMESAPAGLDVEFVRGEMLKVRTNSFDRIPGTFTILWRSKEGGKSGKD